MQIRTILVPVDHSERSHIAVREAASIADKFNAQLLLLHAEESTTSGEYEGAEMLGELEAYAVEELSLLAASDAPGVQSEVLVVSGDVGESVRRVSVERGVDLVVMPTRGQGPYRRFLLGSNTAKALHDVACPILTGAHGEHPEQASHPFSRIACLLDLRGDYAQVFAAARALAESYGAELTAVHLLPALFLDRSRHKDFMEALEGSARLRLENLVADQNAEARVMVRSGVLEETLPHLIEREGFDLLALSRRYGGAEDQDLGVSSEAYAAIRCSPCPVLSV